MRSAIWFRRSSASASPSAMSPPRPSAAVAENRSVQSRNLAKTVSGIDAFHRTSCRDASNLSAGEISSVTGPTASREAVRGVAGSAFCKMGAGAVTRAIRSFPCAGVLESLSNPEDSQSQPITRATLATETMANVLRRERFMDGNAGGGFNGMLNQLCGQERTREHGSELSRKQCR